MKLLIASDIHGDAVCCEKLTERVSAENAEKIIILGDLLYHGPRNDLPSGYDPKRVITLLSGLKDRILCVRGNCDTEVDQMVLPFPILASYALLYDGKTEMFCTHGHTFGEDDPPEIYGKTVLLCGHTHVPAFRRHENFVYVNPGSVSIPKENSPKSYIVYEDGVFTFKDLDGNVYASYTL